MSYFNDIIKKIQQEVGEDVSIPIEILSHKLEIVNLMDIDYLKVTTTLDKEFIIFNKYCLLKYFDKFKETK